jgi:hypothetical protein
MYSQIIAIWALCSLNAASLAALFVRAGIAQSRARRVASASTVRIRLGCRVPPIRCRSVGDAGGLGRQGLAVFQRQSVVVFVRPRSAATFRIAADWTQLARRVPPTIPFTWVVVGESQDAARFVAQFHLEPSSIHCDVRGLARRWSKPLPTSIYVDEHGRVGQVGVIVGDSSMAHFVAGCPNEKLRSWFALASTTSKPRSLK